MLKGQRSCQFPSWKTRRYERRAPFCSAHGLPVHAAGNRPQGPQGVPGHALLAGGGPTWGGTRCTCRGKCCSCSLCVVHAKPVVMCTCTRVCQVTIQNPALTVANVRKQTVSRMRLQQGPETRASREREGWPRTWRGQEGRASACHAGATRTHTQTHTQMCAHMQMHTHVNSGLCVHTHAHITHINARVSAHLQTCEHMHVNEHTWTQTQTCRHTNTCARTRVRMHAQDTHVHVCARASPSLLLQAPTPGATGRWLEPLT